MKYYYKTIANMALKSYYTWAFNPRDNSKRKVPLFSQYLERGKLRHRAVG